jgi:RecJ-like exonuclease
MTPELERASKALAAHIAGATGATENEIVADARAFASALLAEAESKTWDIVNHVQCEHFRNQHNAPAPPAPAGKVLSVGWACRQCPGQIRQKPCPRRGDERCEPGDERCVEIREAEPAEPPVCPVCKGDGRVCENAGWNLYKICPGCSGTGRASSCAACGQSLKQEGGR